jgi:hypothetical protein
VLVTPAEVVVHVAAVRLDGQATGEVGDGDVGRRGADPADAAGALEGLAHAATVDGPALPRQVSDRRGPELLRQPK